jgi:hypothetical protein
MRYWAETRRRSRQGGACEEWPLDAIAFVNRTVSVVDNTIDGTSDAICAIFLNALAHGLQE